MSILKRNLLCFFTVILWCLPFHAQIVRHLQYAGLSGARSAAAGETTLPAREPDAKLSAYLHRSLAKAPASSFVPGNRVVGPAAEAMSARTAPAKDPVALTVKGGGHELRESFDGLNYYQQRNANDGNQYAIEPTDPGLCAGNGFVLETVNEILRVFDTHGNPVAAPLDVYTFYGYPPAINRTTGAFGPSITDEHCFYDKSSRRWFHIAHTLDRDPLTNGIPGTNHLDLAVSRSDDPTGSWSIYKLPVQDDGTDGTPNHACQYGPCFGDFPQIAVDKNGIYITTNEFAFFGPGFHGSQIYALSKKQLIDGESDPTVVQFDTADAAYLFEGNPGYSVQPALDFAQDSPGGRHGTEFLLSNLAGFNTVDDRLQIWSLKNTESLAGHSPQLSLKMGTVTVKSYSSPPDSVQKPGPFPLGQCINDTTLPTPYGAGCWRNLLLGAEPAHNETLYNLPSNDGRMTEVVISNGKLWGSFDTTVTIAGQPVAGLQYFALWPWVNSSGPGAKVLLSSNIGVKGNNLTYPSIAATPWGRAVIAYTLIGPDYYPASAYTMLDVFGECDKTVRVAAAGKGPQDGFEGYAAFGSSPRWGTYSSALLDGDSFWINTEYIGQSCTLAEYASDPPASLSCGKSRATLANWGTRISRISPNVW